MFYIKNKQLKEKDYKLKTFLIIFISTLLFLLPSLIKLNGAFVYSGDFLSQTIPFNMHCNDAIKEGATNWDWYNGLGTDYMEAFEYYTVGSPFFYLGAIFPSSWFPYLVAPIIAIKLGLAGIFAYIYMKEYVKNKEYAMLGAVMYAFSGWAIYNLFFYTFLDALIFLPLMLYTFDKTLDGTMRGAFALILALCTIDNFYFCFQICLFIAIYFFVKLFKKEFAFNKKLFFILSIEIVIGILISCIVLFPAMIYSFNMPRIAGRYDEVTFTSFIRDCFSRTGNPLIDLTYVLENYVFHSMTPSIRPLFDESSSLIWQSSGFALPIVSVVIFPNFIIKNKKSWISVVSLIMIIGSFIPLFSMLFNAFSATYLRWTFILTLFIAMMSVMVLEDKTFSLKKPTIFISVAVMIFLSVLVLVPSSVMNSIGFPTSETGSEFINLKTSWVQLTFIELVILIYCLTIWRKDSKAFFKRILSYTIVVSILAGFLSITPSASGNIDKEKYVINNYVNASVDFNDDNDNYRIGTSVKYNNLSYRLGYQCPEVFQTATSNSSVEFYVYLGYKIGGAVKYYDNEEIFTFLGTKYFVTDKTGYFEDDIESKVEYDVSNVNKKGELKFKGYTYLGKQNNFNTYKNNNYLPYGFTYKGYYLESDVEKLDLSIDEKTALLFRGLLVSDEDEKYISKYYNKINIKEELKDISYDKYVSDVNSIKSDGLADDFKITDKGFTCNFNANKDNVLFFQIPYHDGWSAYVNGEKVDVIKSNVGFMSIPVKEGTNNIVFEYSNPNRTIGCYISCMGLSLFVIYMCCIILYKKKKEKVNFLLFCFCWFVFAFFKRINIINKNSIN